MVQKKTTQKTVQKTAHRTIHRVGLVARGTGKWLWDHRRPILVGMTWLGVGTIIGAVRVIPPPAHFVKLGLFRIGTG